MKLMTLANPFYQEAVVRLASNKLPIKTAYKLKTIINTINQEIQKFEELRKSIISRYIVANDLGIPLVGDDGRLVLKDLELSNEYEEALKELSAIEVDIPSISIDELGDIQVSTKDLDLLGDLITG